MGSTTSCSIRGISFLSQVKLEDIKKRLIQHIAKDQNNYYIDYDFTAYDIICCITNTGLQFNGSIKIGTQTGKFTIDKVKLLQRCCKCQD